MESNFDKLSKFDSFIQRIHILGGEPLLNPELSELLSLTRKFFPKTEINLVTNGILILHPEKLPRNFWSSTLENMIKIKVTEYPININYKAVEEICKSHKVEFEFSFTTEEVENRWNKIELEKVSFPYLRSKINIKNETCRRSNCINLVGDKLYSCPITGYLHVFNSYFGTDFRLKKGDYIEIKKIKTEKDLKKVLHKPLPFCVFCNTVENVGWELSKRSLDEWAKKVSS